jgi:hypothetical protein
MPRFVSIFVQMHRSILLVVPDLRVYRTDASVPVRVSTPLRYRRDPRRRAADSGCRSCVVAGRRVLHAQIDSVSHPSIQAAVHSNSASTATSIISLNLPDLSMVYLCCVTGFTVIME